MISNPSPEKPLACLLAGARQSKDASYWIFDLDNTLYSPNTNVFQQIDRRMCGFIVRYLDCTPLQAFRLQKSYYRRYGATLLGLMFHHGVDAAYFCDYVHDIDLSFLQSDIPLGKAINALPGRKYVFTNGSASHACNVLEKLALTHCFAGIFDLSASGYIPKPYGKCYDLFFSRYGLAPKGGVFFEDTPANLRYPKTCGMTTVLCHAENKQRLQRTKTNFCADTIRPHRRSERRPKKADNKRQAEKKRDAEAFIDFYTDDLQAFLTTITHQGQQK